MRQPARRTKTLPSTFRALVRVGPQRGYLSAPDARLHHEPLWRTIPCRSICAAAPKGTSSFRSTLYRRSPARWTSPTSAATRSQVSLPAVHRLRRQAANPDKTHPEQAECAKRGLMRCCYARRCPPRAVPWPVPQLRSSPNVGSRSTTGWLLDSGQGFLRLSQPSILQLPCHGQTRYPAKPLSTRVETPHPAGNALRNAPYLAAGVRTSRSPVCAPHRWRGPPSSCLDRPGRTQSPLPTCGIGSSSAGQTTWGGAGGHSYCTACCQARALRMAGRSEARVTAFGTRVCMVHITQAAAAEHVCCETYRSCCALASNAWHRNNGCVKVAEWRSHGAVGTQQLRVAAPDWRLLIHCLPHRGSHCRQDPRSGSRGPAGALRSRDTKNRLSDQWPPCHSRVLQCRARAAGCKGHAGQQVGSGRHLQLTFPPTT